jgi:hypothetical protein
LYTAQKHISGWLKERKEYYSFEYWKKIAKALETSLKWFSKWITQASAK